MSASVKSSRSCASFPVGGNSWEKSEGDANDSTGSNNPPADGVEIWAGAEAAAARTSSGRNERIFQGSSAQERVQYTMTQNLPINNDGKVPASSKVAHPTRVPGSKVDAETMASVNSPGAPSLTPQPEAPNKRLLPWLVAVAFLWSRSTPPS